MVNYRKNPRRQAGLGGNIFIFKRILDLRKFNKGVYKTCIKQILNNF